MLPTQSCRHLPVLALALCLSGAAFAQSTEPAAIEAKPAPAADTARSADPFAQSRDAQAQARWILVYGALFAAAVGFLVWRQQE
jgi:hypothetical protein